MPPVHLAAIFILTASAAFAQQTSDEETASNTPRLDETRTESAEVEVQQEEEVFTLFGVPVNGGLLFKGRRSHAELRSSNAFSGARHHGQRFFDPAN